MKRALSVAAVTALSLLVILFVGYAQEEGAQAVSELLEQELASMEAVFGGLEGFMHELITEIKGNMADIYTFNAKVDDLKDIVTAVSLEIKQAEGKIVGLREDVDQLGEGQQELLVRVVALEAGLSELAAFCDELKTLLDANILDVRDLRAAFDALYADYTLFREEFAAFREAVYGDIDALRDGVYADLILLEETFSADLMLLGETLSADLDLLEKTFGADLSMLRGQYGDLSLRVLALEEEDVGTFKKKVIELERSMAALAIRIDNNRTKLEGFDHAIAGMADEMEATRTGILEANQELLGEFDARLQAVEENTDVQAQIESLYFISIVALLAGVGALIWGFLGN